MENTNKSPYHIDDVCDYVIYRLNAENEDNTLNSLKLQKLLYYIQAWHFAFFNKPIIKEDFQAWVHGPVNRAIYDRFKDRMLFFPITTSDIKKASIDQYISEADKEHIDAVLEAYAQFSGVDLERMTHQEKPWMEARKGYASNERCETSISTTTMGAYYSERVKNK
jgi:uncharacterized phage-associated protein